MIRFWYQITFCVGTENGSKSDDNSTLGDIGGVKVATVLDLETLEKQKWRQFYTWRHWKSKSDNSSTFWKINLCWCKCFLESPILFCEFEIEKRNQSDVIVWRKPFAKQRFRSLKDKKKLRGRPQFLKGSPWPNDGFWRATTQAVRFINHRFWREALYKTTILMIYDVRRTRVFRVY